MQIFTKQEDFKSYIQNYNDILIDIDANEEIYPENYQYPILVEWIGQDLKVRTLKDIVALKQFMEFIQLAVK